MLSWLRIVKRPALQQGALGGELGRFAAVIERWAVLAQQDFGLAQPRQGLGVVRYARQDRPVELLGLRRPSGLERNLSPLSKLIQRRAGGDLGAGRRLMLAGRAAGKNHSGEDDGGDRQPAGER